MVWVLGEQTQDPLDCFLKVVIFVKFLVATVMQSNLSKKKKFCPTRRRFQGLAYAISILIFRAALSGVRNKKFTCLHLRIWFNICQIKLGYGSRGTSGFNHPF